MITKKFSVVITTYENDDAGELSEALDSVFDQTFPPSEVILVEDGPVTASIDATVKKHQERHGDKLIVMQLESNQGQGYARRLGVERASHEYIGMMDADDISVPHRFETQMRYLHQHSDIDAVGGYIAEFSDDKDSPHAIRKVPIEPETVASKARFRSPLNQTTVMARQDALIDAGNYRDVDRMEDYGLWARMLSEGFCLANIPEVLAKVRGGNEMYSRRGGWEYVREEIRLQHEFLDMEFVSLPIALINLTLRIPTRLLPSQIRGAVYSIFLRDNGGSESQA